MKHWSSAQRALLAVATLATFTAVLVLAERDGPIGASDTTLSTASPPVIAIPSPPGPETARSQEAASGARVAETEPAALPSSTPESPAQVAELTRQAMPVDETTAEENEQRGDALRRLGQSGNADAVSGLVYALRNDVDVRNRILAVDGLRRAALAGNADRTITDALADAARSDDEVIAAQARAALDELGRR